MSRPIFAEISLSSLRHNYLLAKDIGENKKAKTWAVVKANAYGHGLKRCVNALKDLADGFAIIEIDYAIVMRKSGIENPILLLEGFFESKEIKQFEDYRLTPVIHSFEQIKMFEKERISRPLAIYLKFNTGMNRLGFKKNQVPDILKKIENLKSQNKIADLILMTHFATADNELGIDWQTKAFREIIDKFKNHKFKISISNSASILRFANYHCDWQRPGIMLYGSSPFGEFPGEKSAKSLNLKPVMSLKSKVIGIQNIESGDIVGYGGAFKAKQNTRIGIVACGYGDGYPRHAKNGTPIFVDGKPTQIIGRVSMDKITCDLTNLPNTGIGSEVELWGNNLSVDAVANYAETISYELFCGLANRVPKIEKT